MNNRQLSKLFNKAQREIRRDRKNAVRTLSPSQISSSIKSGKISPSMAVLIGSKSDGTPFSIKDLEGFRKQSKQASSKFGKTTGAKINQLIAASLPIDVKRSNRDIKRASLIQIGKSGTCTFSVTASPESNKTHHKVQIRLEGWAAAVSSSDTATKTVKGMVDGNVSFDCACGRHQFWYRYLATIGNYAIAPFEKDFPKIRNPNLVGCCCKHSLKAMATIKSPTVQKRISNELERQRSKGGFASGKIFSQKEMAEISKAKPRKIDLDRVQKAFSEHLKKNPSDAKKAAKLLRSANAKIQKLEAVQRESVKNALEVALPLVDLAGADRKTIIKSVATKFKMPVKSVESIAKGIK